MGTPSLLLMLAVSGQATPTMEARTVSGEPASGELRAIASDGSIKLGDRTIAAGEWYSLRRTPGVLPPWPRDPHVELTSGDRIVGTIAEADGDALRLHLPAEPADQTIRLPLSSLRAVWTRSRPADEPDPEWLTGPR